jgi:hypothetical protein
MWLHRQDLNLDNARRAVSLRPIFGCDVNKAKKRAKRQFNRLAQALTYGIPMTKWVGRMPLHPVLRFFRHEVVGCPYDFSFSLQILVILH